MDFNKFKKIKDEIMKKKKDFNTIPTIIICIFITLALLIFTYVATFTDLNILIGKENARLQNKAYKQAVTVCEKNVKDANWRERIKYVFSPKSLSVIKTTDRLTITKPIHIKPIVASWKMLILTILLGYFLVVLCNVFWKKRKEEENG